METKQFFYFTNTNQKYRSECVQFCSIKQKEWRDKNCEESKNHKKQYYEDNRERIRNQQKNFYENRDVIIRKQNNYERNRSNTDLNHRLVKNTRRRIHHALNVKTKSSSIIEFSGIDFQLYRKCIESQFTTEMNWTKVEMDHAKAICLFDVSKNEELKEAFTWRNTQPLLKHDHHLVRTKFNLLDCQLQFNKAYQFLKINEEERLK